MISKARLQAHARDNSCIRCGADNNFGLSHYNGYRSHSYGKGRGIKASDIATADFCYECDQLFCESKYADWDGGSKSIDRSELFLHWVIMTNIRRANHGVFK